MINYKIFKEYGEQHNHHSNIVEFSQKIIPQHKYTDILTNLVHIQNVVRHNNSVDVWIILNIFTESEIIVQFWILLIGKRDNCCPWMQFLEFQRPCTKRAHDVFTFRQTRTSLYRPCINHEPTDDPESLLKWFYNWKALQTLSVVFRFPRPGNWQWASMLNWFQSLIISCRNLNI